MKIIRKLVRKLNVKEMFESWSFLHGYVVEDYDNKDDMELITVQPIIGWQSRLSDLPKVI